MFYLSFHSLSLSSLSKLNFSCVLNWTKKLVEGIFSMWRSKLWLQLRDEKMNFLQLYNFSFLLFKIFFSNVRFAIKYNFWPKLSK